MKLQEMSEKTLKRDCLNLLRPQMPGAVVLNIENDGSVQTGVPDTFIAVFRRCCWIEFKYVDDKHPFKSREIQKITCLRLAGACECWYVIYENVGGRQATYIVHPKIVMYRDWKVYPAHFSPSIDHESVVKFIKDRFPAFAGT